MEQSTIHELNSANESSTQNTVEKRAAIDPETMELQERALTAVNAVRGRFARMDAKLQEAAIEVARLRFQLQQERSWRRKVAEFQVGPLRRKLAFHLHPDRGGASELMIQVNALFDFIEAIQHAAETDLAA